MYNPCITKIYFRHFNLKFTNYKISLGEREHAYWYTHLTQSFNVSCVLLGTVLIKVTFYLELGFSPNCVRITSIVEETLHDDNTLMHEFLPLCLLSSLNMSVGIHYNDNDPYVNKQTNL